MKTIKENNNEVVDCFDPGDLADTGPPDIMRQHVSEKNT